VARSGEPDDPGRRAGAGPGAGGARSGADAGAILVLDGGIDVELGRRGVVLRPSAGAAPVPVREPTAVRRLHLDVAIAGADVLTAATGETHRRALARIGESRRVREWTDLAVRLAREASDAAEEAGRRVLPLPDGSPRRLRIAGLVEPIDGRASPEDAGDGGDDEYRAHAGTLAEVGVDLLRLEGMRTIRECDAALAAGVATGLPVWAGIQVGDDGTRLRSGEPLGALRELVARHGPEALVVAGPTNGALERALDELGRHGISWLGVSLPEAAPGGRQRPVVVVPRGRMAAEDGGWRRNGSDGSHDGQEGEPDAERGGAEAGDVRASLREAGADRADGAATEHAGERTNGDRGIERRDEAPFDAVASRFLERGASLIGPGDDGSPARVGALRTVADRVEDLLRERMAAEDAAWSDWLDEGARRAGGGRALWLRTGTPGEPPGGFAWEIADRSEIHRLPRDRFSLVAADARGLAIPELRRLVDLLEAGGWLLVAAGDTEADMLRADDRLEGLAPAGVDPPGARGWIGRRRH